VLGRLLASLGPAVPTVGPAPTAADLDACAGAFDPAALPREPWTLTAADLA
jgi:hypothetical protein